ncbi:MAG: N,N-dimethylformamidase beta subunit family domain-containing protein [Pseudomonadota bacterium]|nr:N,N-dimethylformamidase beta subunit family domain-containing protein [Pseudomonadota bacterium]
MIAGYCWPQSGKAGEVVSLHLHSDHGPVDVAVVRVGAREAHIAGWTNVIAPVQPMPENAALTGCDWPATLQIRIENDWQTGFYRVDIRSGERSGEAFFVVKAQDNTQVDAVLVLATSTWAAYNDWGGPSYYTGGTVCALKRPLPRGFLKKDDPRKQRCGLFIDWTEEDQVSFRKAGYSGWSLPAGWAGWEQLFVEWAETQGLSLAYGVSQDLIFDDSLLDGVSLYLSVGHDEYWSGEMRDRIEAFIDEGGNAAFFSGNTCFWQARYDDDRWVSYKMDIEADPVFDENGACDLATMWSDPLIGRPENEMTGVSFTRGGYAHMANSPRGTGGYHVWRPDHWAFTGVELAEHEDLGARQTVVAYECDGCAFEMRDGLPVPTGIDGTPLNMQILASAPARLWETHQLPDNLRDDYVGELNWVSQRIGGDDNEENRAIYGDGHAVMGMFKRGRGEVFTTGCTDWAYGLVDPKVSRVTLNIINRFLDTS